MENQTILLSVIFGVSAVVLILLGLRLLFAPERRRSSYHKVVATIVSRGNNRDGGFFPVVQYEHEGSIVETHLIYSMSDSPEKKEGYRFNALYYPKRVFGLNAHTVMEDDGKSFRRVSRIYLMGGLVFLCIGLGVVALFVHFVM